MVRGPGGHALTDFWEEKGLFAKSILNAVLMISHVCRAVITCCVHVIEVFGVSLLVPSRIGIIMYEFTHPMLLCAHTCSHTRGPGHRPFGEKF
jgi:hypothetical protein